MPLSGSPVTFTASGVAVGTGARAHEPAGMQVILDERWIDNVSNGWNGRSPLYPNSTGGGGVQFVNDGSAPSGDGKVMYIWNGANGGVAYGGSSSVHYYKFVNSTNYPAATYPNRPSWRRMYIQSRIYVPTGYPQNIVSTQGNKCLFGSGQGGTTGLSILTNMQAGAGGSQFAGPWKLRITLNAPNAKDGYTGATAAGFIDKGLGVGVGLPHPRDQWVNVEAEYYINTTTGGVSNTDGLAKLTIDGVTECNNDKIAISGQATPTYNGTEISYLQMRGGGPTVCPVDGAFYVDNYYVSMGV